MAVIATTAGMVIGIETDTSQGDMGTETVVIGKEETDMEAAAGETTTVNTGVLAAMTTEGGSTVATKITEGNADAPSRKRIVVTAVVEASSGTD